MRTKILTIVIFFLFVGINLEAAENGLGPAGTWEASDSVAIQIDAAAPQMPVSPELYGSLLEINHNG